MVSEPVQQGPGKSLGAEHLGPLVEGRLVVIASRAFWISGKLRTESMSACVTDSNLPTWRSALSIDEGAKTELAGANKSPTLGSLTTSLIKLSI